ncbi:MAG: PP0621 family protein [Chloroflexota bacterium]
MLLRLVVIFAVLYVLLSVLKSVVAGAKGKSSTQVQSKAEAEEMVFDPQCQSYIPKSGALTQSGKYFCSQECARLYRSR